MFLGIVMDYLRYTISLCRADLCRDIAGHLEREWPRMAVEERFQRADKAIDKLLTYGNMAVYEGLIAVGVREAKSTQK